MKGGVCIFVHNSLNFVGTELEKFSNDQKIEACTIRLFPDWPWGPPSLLYNGYWVFPWGKGGRGVTLTTQPPSSAEIMKEQSYTSTPPLGLHGLLQGENLSYLTIRLLHNSYNICILTIYTASTGNFTHFIKKIETILGSLYTLNMQFIIYITFFITGEERYWILY